MSSRPALILDFDGVICDSTEECVVTAWNAWMLHSGWRRTVRTAEEVPEPYLTGLRSLRSYVRTAGEYYILIDVIRSGGTIASQEDYDRLVQHYRNRTGSFAELFFSARNRMRSEDEEHWVGLHQVYPGIPESLRKIWDRFSVFVVTGKDRASVHAFFRQFGLPLSDSQIFDKAAAEDKLGTIRALSERQFVPMSRIVFLDDNVHHLLPAHGTGCHPMMAGWGYHTDEQVELAESNQIPIVTLESWADAALAEVI